MGPIAKPYPLAEFPKVFDIIGAGTSFIGGMVGGIRFDRGSSGRLFRLLVVFLIQKNRIR